MSKLRKATLTSNFVKVGIHSEWGDGKTRFGMSMPGPRAWLDPAHGARYFAVPDDYITNTRDIDSFQEAVDESCEHAHKGEVSAIIFDDVTVMQRQFTGVLADDPDEVKMGEWGPIKGIVNRMMDKVMAAPAHLLITSRAAMIATETQTVDGKEKIKNVHKAARPKAWDEWIYPVDYQLFLFSKGSELAPDKLRYFAQIQKSRAGHLYPSLRQGTIIEDPTFDKVFAELLAAEAGMPKCEYDDPEALIAASRVARAKDAPDVSAKFEALRAALRAADSKEALLGAWTKVSIAVQAGELTTTLQKELLAAKNETKARLGL